jgi:hypothetical protein
MGKDSPSIFDIAPLRGEAVPGKFGLRTGDGLEADPSSAIFPIVKYDAAGVMDLLGTGFFISTVGLFVTARHVLSDPFDRRGNQVYPIAMIHYRGDGTYFIRPILRCALHPVADVAVGVCAPMAHNLDGTPLTNKIVTLTTVRPELQSPIFTYAYPKYATKVIDGVQAINFVPTYYDGNIVEDLPNGRDRVLLPGPCYRTNIAIHHGASGGPVFSPSRSAFALNSTGFDGTDDSYVSSIKPIFDLRIDDVVMNDQPAQSVPIIEMARAGHIVVCPSL